MPIYKGVQRKSFIPDFYRKISILRKTTPYLSTRKSSPCLNEKKINEKESFVKDSSIPVNKTRKSFGHKKDSNTKLINNTKNTKTKNGNGNFEESNDSKKSSTLKTIDNNKKIEEKKKDTYCRKSEAKSSEKKSFQLPRRFTFTYRNSQVAKKNSITEDNPKENELATLCQLLLLRTISPESKENLSLTDQFDMQLDKNYFEYYPYVFKYLCEREQAIKFNKNYLISNGFSESFRCTLIDWLIKVQQYSKIQTEALQVAVILVDMFTSLCLIKKSFYQLVGVTGLLIACKVVQRFHPRITELCFLTEDCYLPCHVIQMEKLMLDKMNFFVNVPIPMHFCHRGLLACIEIIDTNQLELFCNFLFDLVIMHPKSPSIRSSCKSAAAIFFARFVFYSEYSPWTTILQHYTLYKADQLKECVFMYLEMFDNLYESHEYRFRAVIAKYSMPIRKSIAKNEILVRFVSNSEMKQKMKTYFEKGKNKSLTSPMK